MVMYDVSCVCICVCVCVCVRECVSRWLLYIPRLQSFLGYSMCVYNTVCVRVRARARTYTVTQYV